MMPSYSAMILIACCVLFSMSVLAQKTCPSRPRTKTVFQQNQKRLKLFVDPIHGNDAWKGTILKPNRDENGPFKTIYAAIKGARIQRKSLSEKVTIFLRGGTHQVTETIRMEKRDSDISIVGYPRDKRPIVSGAETIPGASFTKFDHKIWVAPFSGSCSRHVFLGSKRLVRARKPNMKAWKGTELTGEGPYLKIKDLLLSTPDCNKRGSGGFKQVKCSSKNKKGFVFQSGDIDSKWVKSQGKSNAPEVVIFQAWTAERGRVKLVTKSNKVMFERPLRFPIGRHPKPSGWRYIVENVRAELDAVGEFFCDSSENLLYVIPPEGAFPKEDVHIAQTATFFAGRNVKHIAFSDLEFRYSQSKDIDNYNLFPALMDMRSSDTIKVNKCEFKNVGYVALSLLDCINVKIQENFFLDVGYFGITAIHNHNTPRNEFSNKNILIDSNTLLGCGVTNMFQPACMLIQGVKNIIVRRNDVSMSSYAGIRVGWQPTFHKREFKPRTSVFKVTRNNVHDFGNGILNDFAGIYLSTNAICGSAKRDLDACHLPALISRNTIHDSKPYLYGGIGVYGDTAVSSLKVSRNWLYNLAEAAINFHCGHNNIAINNMIYHTNGHRVFGTCKSIGPGSVPRQLLTFRKNVVYVADTKARMFGRGDAWSFDVPRVERNVYFFNPYSEIDAEFFFPKYQSWESWRNKTGNDRNSVIANPQYWSVRNNDYRLRATSPALRLGIRSFDLRSVKKRSGVCNR